MNRSNSSIWRAWRQTSIKVFVGLNILIIVGFYAATSSFHLGLSHLDEGPASGNADSSNSGRTGEFLLIRWRPNGSKHAFAALYEAMAAHQSLQMQGKTGNFSEDHCLCWRFTSVMLP